MKKVMVVLAVFVLVSGCATQATIDPAPSLACAGFWHGIWHGLIAPISWIVSLFNPDVAIYASYNTGWSYDLGFLLSVGGSGATAGRSKK